MNISRQPIRFWYFKFSPLPHCKYPPDLTRATNHNTIQRPEYRIFKHISKRIQIYRKKHPRILLNHPLLKRIPKREILKLLFPLHSRDINSLLITIQIINSQLYGPIGTDRNEYLEYDVALVKTELG